MSSPNQEHQVSEMYARAELTTKLVIPITNIGSNIKDVLQNRVAQQVEGKCGPHGFVQPNSCELITYSCGTIARGGSVVFDIVYECQVCYPVEGMILSCVVSSVTNAGISSESSKTKAPYTVFVARDHYYDNKVFADVKKDDVILVRIIGQRFELNDPFISVIGEYLSSNK